MQRLTLDLPDDLREQLRQKAFNERRTAADIIRELLRAYVAEPEKTDES